MSLDIECIREFDETAALKHMQGDRVLFKEIFRSFCDTHHEMLLDIERALKTDNGQLLSDATEKLAEVSKILGAERCVYCSEVLLHGSSDANESRKQESFLSLKKAVGSYIACVSVEKESKRERS